MTVKQRADDLFDQMYFAMPHQSTTNAETYIIAKRCTIVCIDELIKYAKKHGFIELKKYYKQVKQEIEKL